MLEWLPGRKQYFLSVSPYNDSEVVSIVHMTTDYIPILCKEITESTTQTNLA